MGLRGIIRFFAARTFEILVLIVLIVFMPNIPPHSKINTPYKVTPPKLEGVFAVNERLRDVEIWHKADLHGPEAFADFNGELFTTLQTGEVAKLTGNHITPVIKFGKPCKEFYEEEICGRPLGMNFDKKGTLYVADAYYGIFKVNVKTGDYEQIVSKNIEIDGKKPKLPNSVVVASNGDIYWTDSSTEFTLQDGIFDMFADGSGRLIHYDSKKEKNTVLIDELHFANGVALSENEEFVIVAETGRNRLHRYYIKGPKKGSHDIFIDNLPGMPDNLKSDGRGGFLVPLVISVDTDHPSASQIFGQFPLIRKFIARIFGLTELGFKLIHQVYPNAYAQQAIHFVGHFTSLTGLISPKRQTVLHVSKDGKVLDCLHGMNGKVTGISDVHIFKDNLYLGSPFNDYIGRIPLQKIGWTHLKSTPTPKPATTTTTTQKPTTTTPKPTTTTTPKPTTTTTPKPATTTTSKPATTTTSKPATTTTPKAAPTTTPKPTTTTPKPATATPKPVTAAPKVTTTTTPKPSTTAPKVTTTPKPAPTNAEQVPPKPTEPIKQQTTQPPKKP